MRYQRLRKRLHKCYTECHGFIRSHPCIITFSVLLWTLFLSQTQSQIYVTTDGQSASLSWYKAPMWGVRRDIYFCQLQACRCGALFLTRGRVCHLLELQSAVISLLSGCTICILHVIKFMYMQHIYKASVSPDLVQQVVPYHLSLLLQQQSNHLNGRMLDRRQV
jgi:hypothetical protein